MSSVQELCLTRLYRSFQTSIELCEDRGYVIQKPKRLVKLLETRRPASQEARGCSSAACVTFAWFAEHFTSRGAQRQEEKGASGGLVRRMDMTLVAVKYPSVSSTTGMTTRNPEEHEKRGHSAAKPSDCPEAQQAKKVMRVSPPQQEEMAERSKSTPAVADDDGDATVLVVYFTASAPLPFKEVMELRSEAVRHHRANGMLIVAPAIPNLVRRETCESCGAASFQLQVHKESQKRREQQQQQQQDSVAAGEGVAVIENAVARAVDGLRTIELFEEQQLIFNPSHHETTPKHIVLSEMEMQAMLEKYQVQMNQLPRIEEADPMVRYTGARRGNVIRILRESKDSGPYDMYRQVI